MANEYGFFAAKDHDRRYSADDLSALFADFFSDGVYGKNTSGLMVCAAGGMNLRINGGTAYIKGRWFRRSEDTEIALTRSDVSYGRYDAVALRCDMQERSIYLTVIGGTPSGTPQKPSPVRTEECCDLILAYVFVGANTAEITQADISDTRGGSLCGFVTNAVGNIDTSSLFAQYDAAWDMLMAGFSGDEQEIIDAFRALTTVKKINGMSPASDGNITLTLDDIPGTAASPKNNFILQKGTLSVGENGSANVTFPVPFSSAPTVIAGSSYFADGVSSFDASVSSVTRYGFTAHNSFQSGAYSGTIHWLAAGV